MANNRMMIVCNKCYPTDEDLNSPDIWENICVLGKWYPIGSYRTRDNEVIGERVNEYLDKHAHDEDITAISDKWVDDPKYKAALAHNENPVRLTYESWVIDPKPLMKKYEPTTNNTGRV